MSSGFFAMSSRRWALRAVPLKAGRHALVNQFYY